MEYTSTNNYVLRRLDAASHHHGCHQAPVPGKFPGKTGKHVSVNMETKKKPGLMKGNQRLGGTLGGFGGRLARNNWCPLLVADRKAEVSGNISYSLRLLTPPMETPDPPNDTPGALKQVVLTPHDIPWSLRASSILFCQSVDLLEYFAINRLTEIDLKSNMQYRNRQILKELPFPNQRF